MINTCSLNSSEKAQIFKVFLAEGKARLSFRTASLLKSSLPSEEIPAPHGERVEVPTKGGHSEKIVPTTV